MFILISQSVPVYPGEHTHRNALMSFTQVASFTQGALIHSSNSNNKMLYGEITIHM